MSNKTSTLRKGDIVFSKTDDDWVAIVTYVSDDGKTFDATMLTSPSPRGYMMLDYVKVSKCSRGDILKECRTSGYYKLEGKWNGEIWGE